MVSMDPLHCFINASPDEYHTRSLLVVIAEDQKASDD